MSHNIHHLVDAKVANDLCNKVAKSVLAPFNVSNIATAISKPARLLYPTHSLKLSFLHPK